MKALYSQGNSPKTCSGFIWWEREKNNYQALKWIKGIFSYLGLWRWAESKQMELSTQWFSSAVGPMRTSPISQSAEISRWFNQLPGLWGGEWVGWAAVMREMIDTGWSTTMAMKRLKDLEVRQGLYEEEPFWDREERGMISWGNSCSQRHTQMHNKYTQTDRDTHTQWLHAHRGHKGMCPLRFVMF